MLLRFSPRAFRERYGEGMKQTFTDLLHERAQEGRALAGCALWMCAETSFTILKLNIRNFLMANNKRVMRIALAIIGLLSIPLIAMQFTDEVAWSGSDFLIMGIMLSVAGALYEIGARMSTNTPYRVGLATAVGTGLLLTWMNLAVGIIGSENNPANELFFFVVLIGFFGAIISGLKAPGMALAALVTAVAQFLVPIAALIIYQPNITEGEGPGMIGVFILNSFFVGLWLVAARLFKNAAEKSDGGLKPQSV
jgi:hypothetical protein